MAHARRRKSKVINTSMKATAKYLKQRMEAKVRGRQIRMKSGPASMEWMQSALFLYAVKKFGLEDDVRKVLWAYTASMIYKLENILTDAERITKAKNIADSYKWAATQLRLAIKKHLELLKWANDDIVITKIENQGKIKETINYPSNSDIDNMMTYMVSEFRSKNPGIDDILPLKDIEIDASVPHEWTSV